LTKPWKTSLKQKHPAKGGKEGTKRERTQGVLFRRANPKFKGPKKKTNYLFDQPLFSSFG
jgi:hypothetical protein